MVVAVTAASGCRRIQDRNCCQYENQRRDRRCRSTRTRLTASFSQERRSHGPPPGPSIVETIATYNEIQKGGLKVTGEDETRKQMSPRV
jgi:hypothetical protein